MTIKYESLKGLHGMYVCEDCGAIVAYTYNHTMWHEEVENGKK